MLTMALNQEISVSELEKIVQYRQNKSLIDNLTGNDSLDFPYEYIKEHPTNHHVVVVQTADKKIYLPIIDRSSLEAKRTAENMYLQAKRAAELDRLSKKISPKVTRIVERQLKASNEPGVITKEDKVAWWGYLENHLPDNFVLAIKYYDKNYPDPLLEHLGKNKDDFTVNDYFEIYGRPRVSAINGEIIVDGKQVGTYVTHGG